jgi:hypothetical protein
MTPCTSMRFPLRITHSDFQAGYEEALSPYFQDCRIRTDLDLADAVKGMLTEIAEEGHLTEHCLMHNLGFLIGIMSLD